jgi:hypothetical protein
VVVYVVDRTITCMVCASAVRTVNRFHVSLYTHLDEVLRRTQPRKSVVFALDGPAPLAKLLTQRCGPEAASASPRCMRVAVWQHRVAPSAVVALLC